MKNSITIIIKKTQKNDHQQEGNKTERKLDNENSKLSSVLKKLSFISACTPGL